MKPQHSTGAKRSVSGFRFDGGSLEDPRYGAAGEEKLTVGEWLELRSREGKVLGAETAEVQCWEVEEEDPYGVNPDGCDLRLEYFAKIAWIKDVGEPS